jgi:hypothetical protein
VVWEHLRMSSPDDPEERIRQLEQQAANYGAVELGSPGNAGAPPPPTAPLPPPVYGDQQIPVPPYNDPYQGNPYQPPFGTQYTPVQKKGAPVGLISVMIAVVVIAVFGGIGAIVWNVVSATNTVTSNMPSFSTGFPDAPTYSPPSVNIPTPAIPSMPAIPGMPGDDSAQAGSPGELLSIAGINNNKTVACNDAKVNISGVDNTVNLTGHCLSVTVSGVDNHVTIEASDTISASGFDNQVIYKTGDPQIDASGSNQVQRG